MSVTVLHTGATLKYSDNFENAFGKKKASKSAAKKTTKKKASAKKASAKKRPKK